MKIRKETERIHEILGPIGFDDGNGDPKVRLHDCAPYWVARPMGWMSDGVEILLSGDTSGPASGSLDRAVYAFNSLDKIEEEGRNLIRPKIINTSSPDRAVTHYEVNLLWIDCQQKETIAVFSWEGFTYKKWIATLDETNSIVDLQQYRHQI